jgi:hypothetical protein
MASGGQSAAGDRRLTPDRIPAGGQVIASIEADTLRSIKQIDAGEFDYDVQAEGLGEALRLVRTMVRYSHAQEQAEAAPIAPQAEELDQA